MEIFELLIGVCDIIGTTFEVVSGLVDLASQLFGPGERPRR
ncbi:hypothetical protein Pan44_08910 [Caulifigura coniformis]|uniref:Uncharacterized protein n=1 Tax=Caulifigura coniformis TaxID=2527983 RepID=A0A517S9S2_9PLAN|nr:hypothetical protein [Caulifigura coniformis]QDT52878.1 hypothetical protein Pan44_08910 [Caulifigura coniformis]